MLEDIIGERRRKLKFLAEAGVSPYPSVAVTPLSAAAALKNFDSLKKAAKRVTLAGRITALRDQGNIIFADLKDASGKIQAVLRKNNLGNFKLLKRNLDSGDFILVKGILFLTQKKERSIDAKTAEIISKSLRPLPAKWYGLKDVEERFRKRYLDILLNPEAERVVKKRSEIIASLRAELNRQGFVETETPILQPLPGGARARPFVTHHNALDADFYLRVAPELYLKRLLVAGFEKVFEVGRNFRNEGVDRDHNPEFTMLELYWAYQDYRGLMKFCERLLKKFLPPKRRRFKTVEFSGAFRKFLKKDWTKIKPSGLEEIYKKKLRPRFIEPTFVTDYPAALMPLAKYKKDDSRLTESFQLIADGSEIVKGFSEMNDPVLQRRQMEEQEREYRAGDEEASRLDNDFLEALEYGMPPAAGLGIGIDRLAALAIGAPSVKETIIFPTLRPKKD